MASTIYENWSARKKSAGSNCEDDQENETFMQIVSLDYAISRKEMGAKQCTAEGTFLLQMQPVRLHILTKSSRALF